MTYLNSKPLIEGLAERLSPGILILDYPSRLADQLRNGELDVALVPSIEFQRGRDYQIISDACVAARGPVLSVKLYTRVPWGQIKTIALDEGSRTSVMLAQVMLFERYGVLPERVPFPLQKLASEVKADAILMIGDRAMFEPDETFHDVWDLGQEWLSWTGLPFVFAMWVGRPRAGLDENKLSEILSSARDEGVQRVQQIAERESKPLKIPVPGIEAYLGRHLHFTLGSAERHGLELYYELVRNLEAHWHDQQGQHSHRLTPATHR